MTPENVLVLLLLIFTGLKILMNDFFGVDDQIHWI